MKFRAWVNKIQTAQRIIMKTIFTKLIGKSLTGSSKRHKKQRKENMENTPRVYGRGTFF
jgi:hypothetical protein